MTVLSDMRKEAQGLLQAYFPAESEDPLSPSMAHLKSSLSSLIKGTADMHALSEIGNEALSKELTGQAIRYLAQMQEQLLKDEPERNPDEVGELARKVSKLCNRAAMHLINISDLETEADRVRVLQPRERSETRDSLKASLGILKDTFTNLHYLQRMHSPEFADSMKLAIDQLEQITTLLAKQNPEQSEVIELTDAVHALNNDTTAATVLRQKQERREALQQEKKLRQQKSELRDKQATFTLAPLHEDSVIETYTDIPATRGGGSSRLDESSELTGGVPEEQLPQALENFEVVIKEELKLTSPDWQSNVSTINTLREKIERAYALCESLADQEAKYEKATMGNSDRLAQINGLWRSGYERTQDKLIDLDLAEQTVLATALETAEKEHTDDQRALQTLLQQRLKSMQKDWRPHLEYLERRGEEDEVERINTLLETVSADLLALRAKMIEGLPLQTVLAPRPGIDGLPTQSSSLAAKFGEPNPRRLRVKAKTRTPRIDPRGLTEEQQELERALKSEPEPASSDLQPRMLASQALRDKILDLHEQVEHQLNLEKELPENQPRQQEFNARVHRIYNATQEKLITLYEREQIELTGALDSLGVEEETESQTQLQSFMQLHLTKMEKWLGRYLNALQTAGQKGDFVNRLDQFGAKN